MEPHHLLYRGAEGVRKKTLVGAVKRRIFRLEWGISIFSLSHKLQNIHLFSESTFPAHAKYIVISQNYILDCKAGAK
jgi:hypothetical protein